MFQIKLRIRRFKRFNFDLPFYISFLFYFPNLKVRFILLVIKQWSNDWTLFLIFNFWIIWCLWLYTSSRHFTSWHNVTYVAWKKKYLKFYFEKFATWDANVKKSILWQVFWKFIIVACEVSLAWFLHHWISREKSYMCVNMKNFWK